MFRPKRPRNSVRNSPVIHGTVDEAKKKKAARLAAQKARIVITNIEYLSFTGGLFSTKEDHISPLAPDRLVLDDYWAVDVQISHTFQVSEYLDVMYGAEARIMPRDLRISPRSARSRSIFSPTKSFFSENYKITQTLLKRSETVFQVLTNFNINNYGRLSCTEVVFRCENWKSIDQKLAFQS